jgi:hypothetical protein
MVRDAEDLTYLQTKNYAPFDYMFDTDHFVYSFSTACPQMTIYADEGSLPATTSKTDLTVHPIALVEEKHAVAQNTMLHPETWRASFYKWLATEVTSPYSAAEPILITVAHDLLAWPLSYDPPLFVSTFGRILQSRQDIRTIAAKILTDMSFKFNLNLDPSKPGIQPDKFVGAHLRTAKDAATWQSYDTQSHNYIYSKAAQDLKLIYLTTGNPADALLFKDTAAELHIAVVTKQDTLASDEFADERKQMSNMTWDQIAIIDYEVLLRSSTLLGVYESSFTWNLITKRHVLLGGGAWLNIEVGATGVPNDDTTGQCFRDTYSTVFGPSDMGIMWQFPLALWP